MPPAGPHINKLPAPLLLAIFERLQTQCPKSFQQCGRVCTTWRDMIRGLTHSLAIKEPEQPPNPDERPPPAARIDWKDLPNIKKDLKQYPNLTRLVVEIRGIRRIVRPVFWQVFSHHQWKDVTLKGAPERQADKLPPPYLLSNSGRFLESLALTEPHLRAGDLVVIFRSHPNLKRLRLSFSTYINFRGFKEVLDNIGTSDKLVELDLIDSYHAIDGPMEPGPGFVNGSALKQLPSKFPNLEVLTLCRNEVDISSTDMQVLAKGLRHLRRFKFDTCSDLYMAIGGDPASWCDNAALKVLAEKCPRLESFVVGGECHADEQGVRHFLAKAKNLTSFGLAGALAIDGPAWAGLLSGQTKLRDLFIARLDDNLIATIPTLSNLEYLCVEVFIELDSTVSEAEINRLITLAKHLTNMPSFKRLRLTDDLCLSKEKEDEIKSHLPGKELEMVRDEFARHRRAADGEDYFDDDMDESSGSDMDEDDEGFSGSDDDDDDFNDIDENDRDEEETDSGYDFDLEDEVTDEDD